VIRRTTSTDADFLALVRRLDADLRDRYGALQDTYAPLNVLVSETVVVAYVDDVPVGCGAFKGFREDDDRGEAAVELKRMFVAPEQRGAGIGRAIVAALEAWAKELGYRAMVLETGTLQHEAIALYERAGYQRTEPYGPYVGLDHSICMRKSLG